MSARNARIRTYLYDRGLSLEGTLIFERMTIIRTTWQVSWLLLDLFRDHLPSP